MSDKVEADAAAVSASDALFTSVYVPSFVKACAARGLPFDPNDTEQVSSLLKIAYAMRTRAAAQEQKQSQTTGSFLKSAALALEQDTFGGAPAKQAALGADVAAFLSNESIRKAASLVVGLPAAPAVAGA